ncbi:MAG: NAD-dependent epimerase/dehydratase family protein [Steroidobacteraceae bacterium]
MADSGGKVALIAGASGLTGRHLLGLLLEAQEFTRVYAVTRRPLVQEHPRLANRIARFEGLENELKGVACHTAFCCLGSRGWRGEGAADGARRTVELGYVLAFARTAKAAQAQRFVLLSCASAPAGVKAEAERALEALGFASLDILQPGPLVGIRREMSWSELLRSLAAVFASPVMLGERTPHRAISARTVAAAMLGAARSGRRGVYRYTYSAIRKLARTKARA